MGEDPREEVSLKGDHKISARQELDVRAEWRARCLWKGADGSQEQGKAE